MKQISAAEFKKAVDLDPAWASKLTEPVEITDYCEMRGSKISHLSPLLHFAGRGTMSGDCANFDACEALTIAQGTFHGHVSFHQSGIEKIDRDNLHIIRPNDRKNAADFSICRKLKIAEGTFPGNVNFASSGIEKIDCEHLIIHQPNTFGEAASFFGCLHLDVAEGNFPGYAGFEATTITRIDSERLFITQPDKSGKAAGFYGCHLLKCLEGIFPGSVRIEISKIERCNPKKLHIQPSETGEYIRIQGSLLEANPKELDILIRTLFQEKTNEELWEISKATPKEEPALKDAIQNMIHRRETAMRKNAAVEIQID